MWLWNKKKKGVRAYLHLKNGHCFKVFLSEDQTFTCDSFTLKCIWQFDTGSSHVIMTGDQIACIDVDYGKEKKESKL